ncbi:hypothetical protein ABID97_002727 [Variovorax sp. OAS795]|uniref:hypothetical protein n=1 Tax=Variovorax sp. OAS795 TaxID=3034231 RepID=UPI00339935DB
MKILEHYRALIKNSADVFETLCSDKDACGAFVASHNYILEFDALRTAIAERPEVVVLDSAAKEYQFALFALATGQYRHAFGGLRLSFELRLATLQFSAHEIDYRQWASDSKDINWNSLKDAQNGVFSINFIRAFNPAFAEHGKQYSAIAEAVYRECSEFVHGNAGTHAMLPSEINFQNEASASWHQKASIMRLAFTFAYAARYINYIDKKSTDLIEPILIDVLGNLQPIQALFSQPAKVK